MLMSAANHPISVPIAGRTSSANLTIPAPVRVVAGCITISGSGGGTANATLAGLTDVHFALPPTSGQALVYDEINHRWISGRPAWTLPDWASTHIYEHSDTVYHQGQFWRNIYTAGANTGHEPKLLKAEAIGWFRRGGHTIGPLYPEFVEIGDTFLAPTGTITTHFGAHYAVKYHSDTNWTVWEWKVISHGPPMTFGWHKIDIAHKVTHRHYAEPSPVTADETGLLWIFDEPSSTSVPVVPQRYWEPVVLGDYLVSLADVDASKAVAGDTLVMDANGRWVATPVGTTPEGGGLDIATANSLYQPKSPDTQYGAGLPLADDPNWAGEFQGDLTINRGKTFGIGIGTAGGNAYAGGVYFARKVAGNGETASVEAQSGSADTRIERKSYVSDVVEEEQAVILGGSLSLSIYAKRSAAGVDTVSEFQCTQEIDFDNSSPVESEGTHNGTTVKLGGTGAIFTERLARGDNSGQISMAANTTHSMVRLIHNKPIMKTDDTIATLKDIADAAVNLTPYLTISSANSTYSVLGHTHVIANVTGLQTALDSKLPSVNFNYANLTGPQNLLDTELIRAKLRDYSETISSPTISAGTLTLNLETSNIFFVHLTEAITTLNIINAPASGSGGSFTLIIAADGTARPVAWDAISVVKWPNGIAPAITSTAGKHDIFSFFSRDGGSTWFGFIGGQNF